MQNSLSCSVQTSDLVWTKMWILDIVTISHAESLNTLFKKGFQCIIYFFQFEINLILRVYISKCIREISHFCSYNVWELIWRTLRTRMFRTLTNQLMLYQVWVFQSGQLDRNVMLEWTSTIILYLVDWHTTFPLHPCQSPISPQGKETFSYCDQKIMVSSDMQKWLLPYNETTATSR